MVDAESLGRVIGRARTREIYFKYSACRSWLGRGVPADEASPRSALWCAESRFVGRVVLEGGRLTVLGRTIQAFGCTVQLVVGALCECRKSFDYAQGNEELWLPAGFAAVDFAESDKHA